MVVPGIHYWADAPATTETLRYCHPHHFVIRVGFEVTDPDRQVEFFDAQGLIREVLAKRYSLDTKTGYDFDASSCEMIAAELLGCLRSVMAVWVSVFEDDENGAQVELR